MRRLLLSITAAGALVAAGCGSSGGDPDTDPASLAPARAPVYAEVSLKSDDDFKSVAAKLSGKSDPTAEIVKAFESSVKEDGNSVDWEKDIKPWVGDRLGIFLTDVEADEPQAAIIAPTDDTDKAEKALDKLIRQKGDGDKEPKVGTKKYKDVEYQNDSANQVAYAIVDGTAVLGDEQGVKDAIDAQDGQSLAETDALKSARDQVEDDGLVFAFMSLRQLVSSIGGSGPQAAQLEQFLGSSGDRIAISGDVEDDAIDFEFAQLGVKNPIDAEPGKLLEALPGDAWLAGGVGSSGKLIEQSLKELENSPDGKELSSGLAQIERATGIDVRADVLSWMGDAGLFVRGSSINDLGGALIVEASDPSKPEQLLSKLTRLARQSGDGSFKSLDRDGVKGVTITDRELPQPVNVGTAGSKFIIAFGDDALKEAVSPSNKLGDSKAFKDATSKLEDVKPSFFVDLDPVRSLIEASGVLQQAGDDADAVKRVLDHLTTVAAGASTEGDVQKSKFSITVK